jgi:hypothetical protein
VPKDTSEQPLTFPFNMNTDEVFDHWLASLPDIDKREQAAVDELLTDPAYGESKEKHAARLAIARAVSNAVNIAAVVICIGAVMFLRLFAPHPAIIAVIAALPLMALMAIIMSKGLYYSGQLQANLRNNSFHFDHFAKDRLPNLNVVIIAPSVFMLFLGLRYGPAILDWELAALVLLGIGFVVGLFLWWLRTQTPVLPAVIFIFAVFWSSGLVLNCNYICDTSVPSVYRTKITSKQGGTAIWTPKYYINISPWGPQTKAQEISVTREAYGSYSIGEEVCIHLHPGALGVPWYVLLDCQ